MSESDKPEELKHNYIPPEVDVNDLLPYYSENRENYNKNFNELKKQIKLENSILSETSKVILTNIIENNSAAFVQDDGLIGKYKGPINHRIELIDASRITQRRPYRVPMALRPEIEAQINDMLRQRIIRPSCSGFSSPVVLVRKKDGKWRFAVDYRDLNSNTRKQVYFLPLIQDILDSIGGKKIFSSFDFQSGFYQIPMEPDHIERTAFTTFCGVYEFLRMPMGVSGGPNTFQKIMEKLRKELSAAFFVYIDDVVLASLC